MNIQTLIKCYLCCLLQSFAVDGWSQPQVTSFSPDRGPIGTPVTITGYNFNPEPARNIVYFGAVRAQVTAATTTSLTVTAPAGATYKPLTVTDQSTGLTGYSKAPFSITFTNPFINGFTTNFYQNAVPIDGGRTTTIADIDGDGKPDIITGEDGEILVSRNTAVIGSPSLSSSSFAPTVRFPVSNDWNILYIGIGDLDGDGKLDIVVPNYNKASVSVLRNTSEPGSITAASFAPKIDFETDVYSISVAVADIDNDGKPEIITGNVYSVSVLQNTASQGILNTASFAPKVDFGGVSGTSAMHNSIVVASDIDGDGKTDMVVNSDFNGPSIAVFKNTSTRGTISNASFAAPVYFPGDQSVAVGDLDDDGKPDVVVGSTSGFVGGPGQPFEGKVMVYHNTATRGVIDLASLAPPIIFRPAYNSYRVAIADVDGDRKPEIITASLGPVLSVLRNMTAVGAITASSFASRVDFEGTGASVAVADIDGDGIPELFGMDAVYKINNASNTITFNGKVFLQGAYDVSAGAMTNSLNSSGILKSLAAHQPYSTDRYRYAGSEKVDPTFFEAHPDIVDWVLIELRSMATPSNVLATRAAFVKQNGTLIDINGVDAGITFQGFLPGNYHIAIRHRNHLGIRSASPVDFSSGLGNYDFTTAADKSYQNQSYTSTVMIGNAWAMRAGDANTNGNVRYSGPANDQNQLLNSKLGGSLATVLSGVYAPEDVNMDGTIKYNGPGNDQNFLLNTILAGLLSTVYVQQL
ncbi:hypothetical protein EXU57_17140 [Segetibacter sp. 3557_3]|uniref:FG-GAP-like repeat-containing protein n=1 Tax=Segetibacter sp. 3557_3 TaxID=2547429 RepID=UPI0010589B0B|nr:FG-GAP-like repeat-containing protein [Segetibacter sp. 3557_3]TDH23526.1 hypothetical protein EXU57_17140 [Segetibacter sp. 3557_3]